MASRSNANPAVTIENGYGHVIVEQYRGYASALVAAEAGVRGLARWQVDRTADASTYGGSWARRARVCNLTLAVQPGDIVRLLGQSTSLYRGEPFDMHGQNILLDDATLLAPWATENTPWAIQSVPMWTDAVHRPSDLGTHTYSVSMHSVEERDYPPPIDNPIDPNGDSLSILLFRTVPKPVGNTIGLKEMVTIPGPVADARLTANSGWKTLIESRLHPNAGDVLRITGFTQMEYPVDYAAGLGISCALKAELMNAAGSVIDVSPSSSKYITQNLEHLPLRTEQVLAIGKTGDYTLRLSAQCSRQDANPNVVLLGGRTAVLVERYGG